MLAINKIYNLDCLEGIKLLEDESVSEIVTDPPYGIGKDFDNDDLPKDEYITWCKKWINECIRVLEVGGSFYLTLGWQCVAEIKTIFNNYTDMRLKNWIIWYRQDGWKGDNGFAQSHEHILYFIKDNVPPFDLAEFGEHVKQKRLAAGYKTIAEFMNTMGLYNKVKRSDGSEDYWSGNGWFESGKKKPRLQELIRLNQLLDLDQKYKVNHIGKKINTKKFNVFFNKVDVCDDLWLTPKSEKDRLGHPTQKPVKLFERMILASSNEDDLILDPFMGSGTTAVACKKNRRNFIGFETDKLNCEMAEQRLVSTNPNKKSFGGLFQ
jgi:DNA modification methylase